MSDPVSSSGRGFPVSLASGQPGRAPRLVSDEQVDVLRSFGAYVPGDRCSIAAERAALLARFGFVRPVLPTFPDKREAPGEDAEADGAQSNTAAPVKGDRRLREMTKK